MALPHNSITPIPNNEPDAVPSLWNTRYQEIDENFVNIDGRVVARENEINQARGGKGSLDERLDDMDGRVGTTEPAYQEALHFEVRRQMELNQLALTEIEKTRKMRVQQGEVTIYNRGVKNGLSVSKSGTAARNLNVAGGMFFIGGRLFSVGDRTNDASVPPNPGGTTQTCVAYLRINGDNIDFDCSQLGQDAPADAVSLYRLTVPAGNTEANDANLANVTLTDIRRIEGNFPVLLDSPASALISLPAQLPGADWHLDLDVVESQGGNVGRNHIAVEARATNGFRLTLGHTADAVKVRYTLTNMGA